MEISNIYAFYPGKYNNYGVKVGGLWLLSGEKTAT